MSAAKLTTMQIKEIQEKYKNGMTQRELAEEYGVSQSLIQKRCGGPYRAYNKLDNNNGMKYAGIRKYMQDNGLTLRGMAKESGMNYVSLFYMLSGKTDPRKKTIDSILKFTGLTYEQAFGENNE